MTQIEMQYMESVKRIARLMGEQRPIDWEQRRYEIAKDAMNALLQTLDPCLVEGPTIKACADSAVEAADALIERLKSSTNVKAGK